MVTKGVSEEPVGPDWAGAAVWALGGAVLVVTGWAGMAISTPQAWPGGGLSVLIALFLLAVLWWIAAAGWLVTGRRQPLRWLLLAPVAAVLLVGAAATDLPLRARWDSARPAFEHLLAAPPAQFPQPVGGYQVDGVEQYQQGWVFPLHLGSPKDVVAFGYLPHGPAGLPAFRNGPDNRYTDLGGGWYLISAEG